MPDRRRISTPNPCIRLLNQIIDVLATERSHVSTQPSPHFRLQRQDVRCDPERAAVVEQVHPFDQLLSDKMNEPHKCLPRYRVAAQKSTRLASKSLLSQRTTSPR